MYFLTSRYRVNTFTSQKCCLIPPTLLIIPTKRRGTLPGIFRSAHSRRAARIPRQAILIFQGLGTIERSIVSMQRSTGQEKVDGGFLARVSFSRVGGKLNEIVVGRRTSGSQSRLDREQIPNLHSRSAFLAPRVVGVLGHHQGISDAGSVAQLMPNYFQQNGDGGGEGG